MYLYTQKNSKCLSASVQLNSSIELVRQASTQERKARNEQKAIYGRKKSIKFSKSLTFNFYCCLTFECDSKRMEKLKLKTIIRNSKNEREREQKTYHRFAILLHHNHQFVFYCSVIYSRLCFLLSVL